MTIKLVNKVRRKNSSNNFRQKIRQKYCQNNSSKKFMTKFVETYVKIIVKKICQKICQKHNQSNEEMSSIFRYSLILEAPLIQQVDGQLKNEEMRISCIVVFSCWSNFTRLSSGTKTSPKSTCSHVIFVVHFKF